MQYTGSARIPFYLSQPLELTGFRADNETKASRLITGRVHGKNSKETLATHLIATNHTAKARGQVRQTVSASTSKLRSVMEATPILDAVERLFDGKAPYSTYGSS